MVDLKLASDQLRRFEMLLDAKGSSPACIIGLANLNLVRTSLLFSNCGRKTLVPNGEIIVKSTHQVREDSIHLKQRTRVLCILFSPA